GRRIRRILGELDETRGQLLEVHVRQVGGVGQGRDFLGGQADFLRGLRQLVHVVDGLLGGGGRSSDAGRNGRRDDLARALEARGKFRDDAAGLPQVLGKLGSAGGQFRAQCADDCTRHLPASLP